jgi:hypothetical protein
MDDTPGWVEPAPPPGPQQPPAEPTRPHQWGSLPPQYPPAGQYPQYPPPGQYPQYPPAGQYPQYPPPGQYQYPPAWGNFQPEYKPGIVPLRPLTVGEVLDGSFSTIRRHPRIVFGCAAVLAIVAQLIRLGVGVAVNNVPGVLGATGSVNTTDTTGREQLHSVGTSALSGLVSLVVNALCVAVLAGIVTGVVGKAVLGQQPDGREILAAVRTRWLGLLTVSVLAELLPVLPFVLILLGVLLTIVSTGLGVAIAVVGGLVAVVLAPLLWGRLAVAVPIFVLERRGPAASIARSWRLVRGAFWRTFGLRALVSIIVSVAASALSLPVVGVVFDSAVHGHSPSTLALVMVVIFSAIVWTLTQPLIAASLTLIYMDRRMRAEGLDIQLTRAAQAVSAAGAANR